VTGPNGETAEASFASRILGRPLYRVADDFVAPLVAGRRVLVTGAGGFIGAGLVRRVAALGPERVTLVENGEQALYAIDRELAERWPALPRSAVYCDVRDPGAVNRCFAAERPDLVIHAAGLKQVPLLEAQPREAVLTNVVGLRHVAEASVRTGAQALVLISSDKATDGSSVLGATKRLAEAICQAMDKEGPVTRFVPVRFGNVFGSRGSVVPLFADQIARGGPLTLTDAAATRRFVTLGEVTDLVLGAAAVACRSGDRGLVYLIEAGAPQAIDDIARRMIETLGEGQPIDIELTGPRAGETGGFAQSGEEGEASELAGVRRLRPHGWPLSDLAQGVARLERACGAPDDRELVDLIERFVPQFGQKRALSVRAGGEK
jgi:FlaA1/EpsC-like NDP-sugar epimerase